MNVEIDTEGAFGSALVTLEAGEKFVSEAGAMSVSYTHLTLPTIYSV